MSVCISCNKKLSKEKYKRCNTCKGLQRRKEKNCINCGKERSKGAKRCWNCYTKTGFGEDNPNWKGGMPNCSICNKPLPYYDKRTKNHRDCRNKYRREHPVRNSFINHEGYRLLWKPEHPNARKGGYIFEHRVVLEKKLGRYLLPYEIPHHINHIRNDNRAKNLMLLNKKDHDTFHLKLIHNKI